MDRKKVTRNRSEPLDADLSCIGVAAQRIPLLVIRCCRSARNRRRVLTKLNQPDRMTAITLSEAEVLGTCPAQVLQPRFTSWLSDE